MAFYVKAGWDKKCPKKYDGVELKFGENAFASVDEALKALEAENQKIAAANAKETDEAKKQKLLTDIVLVDSKTEWAKEVVVDVTGDSVATKNVNFTGKGSLNLSNGDYSKVTFKLTPAAAESTPADPNTPAPAEAAPAEPTTVTRNVEFDGFSKVTVGDGAVANVDAADVVKDYYTDKSRNDTTLKSEVIKVAGKVEIAAKVFSTAEGVADDKYTNASDYKTVVVKKDAQAGDISADEYTKKYAELDGKKYFSAEKGTDGLYSTTDDIILMTEAKNVATGTVTLEDKASAKSIAGYKTVKLGAEAKVTGDVSSVKGEYNVGEETVAVIPEDKKTVTYEFQGDRQISENGIYTDVKIKDSAVFEDKNVKGSTTITEKAAFNGSFTAAEKAVVEGAVTNFATVKVDGATITGNVEVAATKSVTKKYSYKTKKDGDKSIYTGTYTNTSKTSATGSFTAVDATIGTPAVAADAANNIQAQPFAGAEIKGYKTVKLTNTNAGKITGVLTVSDTAKYESEECTNAKFDKVAQVPVYAYELVDLAEGVLDADLTADDIAAIKNALKAINDKAFADVKVDSQIKVVDGKVYIQAIELDEYGKAVDEDGNVLDLTNADEVAKVVFKFEDEAKTKPVYMQAYNKDGNLVTADATDGSMDYGILSFAQKPVQPKLLVSSSWKSAAAGSVTVSLDKKAPKEVEVGAISNYAKVTLNGVVKEDGNVWVKVDGNITADTNVASWGNTSSSSKNGIEFDDEEKTVKGTKTETDKTAISGSLKATAADVNGAIYAFKTVTLNDSIVRGFYGQAVATGFARSNTGKAVWKWNKKDGKGTETATGNITSKAVGSFTATNSYIGDVTFDDAKTTDKNEFEFDGDSIDFFKTVKLTNTMAGDINGVLDGNESSNVKTTTKSVYTYSSYENANTVVMVEDLDEGGYKYMRKADSLEHEYTTTEKADGKVTVKLDKNADAALDYEVGDISGYKTVDIAGFEKKEKENVTVKEITTGAITAAVNYEETEKYTDKYTYAEGKDPVTERTDAEVIEKTTAVATAKISNANVGNIVNFAKVSLDNVDVTGWVSTNSNVTTKEWKKLGEGDNTYYDWDSVSSYNSVVGSLDMADAKITGSVNGFKSVNVKDGYNTFDHYEGLPVAGANDKTDGLAETEKDAAETIKIAKKATLVTKYLDLQKEDKLVVDGELVLQGAIKTPATDTAAAVRYDVDGEAQISGKGIIYASTDDMKNVGAGFNGTKVDLGATATNFMGKDAELADNSDQAFKAFANNMEGWLGKNLTLAEGFEFGANATDKGDLVDYVKFEANKTYEISAVDGIEWDDKTLKLSGVTANFVGGVYKFAVGDKDTVVGITLEKDGSTSYKIAIANA